MALVLDDRDAAVQYSTGWGEAGVPEEFRGTTSYTETVGATARVTFTGRGITVVGTITILGVKESPVSSYIVDDNLATRFEFTGVQNDQIQRGATFYKIENLDYGEHVLTITCESSAGTLYLDYFEVLGFQNPGGSSSSPSSSTDGPTSNAPLPSSQSTLPNSSPTSLPSTRSSSATGSSPLSSSGSDLGLPASDDAQNQGSNGAPVGAIAGGVVGGVAVICIAILVFILCKRRERKRRDRELIDNYSASQTQPAIQPFVTSHTANASGHYAPSGYGVGSGSSHNGGMMNQQYPNYHTSPNGSGYTMPVASGHHQQAYDYNPSMRDTVSPVPVSSASMVSGTTGVSSGHFPAADSHQRLVVHTGSTAMPHKLVSNMSAAPPNRAPEVDAPPGYQS